MSLEQIIHYATLFWLVMGAISVAVAVINNREQMKTQIFLALSARYDELLQSSSTDFWLGMPSGVVLRERCEGLAILTLRFCTLFSLAYYLFRERRIPERMWLLLLSSAERRIRTPLFAREWEHLRSEFDGYPEFVALVTSLQNGTYKPRRHLIHFPPRKMGLRGLWPRRVREAGHANERQSSI